MKKNRDAATAKNRNAGTTKNRSKEKLERKPYAAPKLVVHGKVSELTQAGRGGNGRAGGGHGGSRS